MSDCPELDGDTLPLWGPMDAGTASTLEVVDADWRRERDREQIDQAIVRIAMKHGGIVNPNLVRAELTNEHGLTVNPRALSARYSALAKAGVLVETGQYVENTDVAGGNAGKPIRLRRYVPERAA